MILFNNLKIDTIELEIASQNLPNNIKVLGSVISDYINMDFILVPYGKDKSVESSNIVFSNNDKSNWASVYDIKSVFIENICKIVFDEIPDNFEFIDFYFQNLRSNVIESCKISFQDKDFVELFSYFFQLPKTEMKNSVFLGTFARVSDGWKFYPKFETYEGDMSDILRRYGEQL